MKLKAAALILTLALGLLAAPVPAEAQQAQRIRRVGMIHVGSAYVPVDNVFQQALRDLGWVEGQTIAIEHLFARLDQKGERVDISALAAGLVDLGAELIISYGTPVTEVVKSVTTTVPIVFGFVSDPIARGFVTSLARPGGNVTGVSILNPELSGKQLELLKEAVPGLTRVGVLVNPAMSYAPAQLREIERTAQALGVQLQILEVRDLEDFERTFSAMTRERADAFIPIPGPITFYHRERLIELAAKHRLPAIHTTSDVPDLGGFMAYGETFESHVRRVATYVDKILKGAKPADLPVEWPTEFELAINLKTAKALGLTIPPSVLIRADRVIK